MHDITPTPNWPPLSFSWQSAVKPQGRQHQARADCFIRLFLACRGSVTYKSIHSGHAAALPPLCNYSSCNLLTTEAWNLQCPLTFWELLQWASTRAGRPKAFTAYSADFPYLSKCARVCVAVQSGVFIPCGRVMQAPSTMACASSRSLHSAARAAARSASQISLRPSKAGAVSQNSSLLLLSWPSVIGYSLFHFGRSFFRGSLRPKIRTEAMLSLAKWTIMEAEWPSARAKSFKSV